MRKGKHRIDYDDDLVIVYDAKGKIIYKGLEDYEPMKDEPWRWDESIKGYRLDGMTKVCIG